MDKEKTRIIKTDEEVKIFTDPFRLRILSIIQGNDEPMTVKQIADRMEVSPAKVHYHVKKLLKVNILELSYTKNIKGIIAKYYTTTAQKFKLGLEQSMLGNEINKVEEYTSRIFGTITTSFLEEVKKAIDFSNNNEKKDQKHNVEMEIEVKDVYLTEEEFEEYKLMVDNFSKKHNKQLTQDQIKYQIFSGGFNSFNA